MTVRRFVVRALLLAVVVFVVPALAIIHQEWRLVTEDYADPDHIREMGGGPGNPVGDMTIILALLPILPLPISWSEGYGEPLPDGSGYVLPWLLPVALGSLVWGTLIAAAWEVIVWLRGRRFREPEP